MPAVPHVPAGLSGVARDAQTSASAASVEIVTLSSPIGPWH